MCSIRAAGQPFSAHIQKKSQFSPLDIIEKILAEDFIFYSRTIGRKILIFGQLNRNWCPHNIY
jgi:hypothetical protein